MVNINVLYTNPGAALRFVENCENEFKRKIDRICDDLVSDPDLKIITLSGPTCSGKTTTASLITAAFEQAGRKAKVISVDDFYFDIDRMLEKGIVNFETIDSIDVEYFSESIYNLMHGNATVLPAFDFKSKKRIFRDEYFPAENDIYIVEGIQAMYPEIMSVLKQYRVKSIFINVDKALSICDVQFSKEELRLMRRIVRDFFHRNTQAQTTMKLWENVRANETASILPHAFKADYLIDSLLPYEVFIISKYFIDITDEYKSHVFGYSVIKSLRERLMTIKESSITSAMVPEGSVFREFIV